MSQILIPDPTLTLTLIYHFILPCFRWKKLVIGLDLETLAGPCKEKHLQAHSLHSFHFHQDLQRPFVKLQNAKRALSTGMVATEKAWDL
ncbi:hypothetical protein Pyn_28944 [Prunus yedoensis var. nudiflora]|uniref:Uncharacterized protein n=1 Tax=Prunus yedoensis var. nudiflora TaxID=2094558 RepID=A0A314ZFB4_PRUYE|nr:hypothetical protein Pyn_28944 [Prunus yedoensis var. nudiflora]